MVEGKIHSDPLTQDFHRCTSCQQGYFQRSTNREDVSCPHCGATQGWQGEKKLPCNHIVGQEDGTCCGMTEETPC